jgi:endonuclease YncB( thermonuclease family)
MVGVFALSLAASFLQQSIDTSLPIFMTATTISVFDGDTVRANGQVYRLVGFDTPSPVLLRAANANENLPTLQRAAFASSLPMANRP